MVGDFLLLLGLLFFKYFYCHIIDGCVVEDYNASVRARLDVNATVLAKLIVHTTEVVANGLDGDVELIGDAVCRSIGQAVFETAQVVE